ncbi:hypothetical protein [Nocardioides sp. AX2bis]|uniref:hypothetical protein n=1 Tax=Nocardioides sp. AX2bis TaxID=2653157 RepID=UPI0012F44B9E|nr:hypothetical protein [Nocardioides sp. AX2bis]VXC11405.1 exported hypothetical protein [Nocardioides sp. AX2bis]
MSRFPVWLALLSVLAMGACGGSTDEAQQESTDPAGSLASPEFAESQTCRDEMSPLVDVMLANDTNGLAFSTFSDRFDRLQQGIDDALTACSSAPARPARLVLYRYSLGNAYWTMCDNGTAGCPMGKIEAALGEGNDAAYRLQDVLQRPK